MPPCRPLTRKPARVSYRAEPGDIDINDHVNNTVYLDWALHSAPECVRNWKLRVLQAAFLAEARLDDEVTCLTEIGRGEGETALLQSLRDEASGRELTRLRTYWQSGLKA